MAQQLTKTTELAIEGMSCASCVAHVTHALEGVPGVQNATVNLATERATVVHDTEVEQPALIAAVEGAGYEASPPLAEDVDAQRRDVELARKRRLLVFAIVLFVPTLILGMFAPEFAGKGWILFGLTLPVWAIVGWEFHGGTLAALRSGTTTMDTLVSLGSTAAFGLSVYEAIEGRMTYFETASAIVTLVYVGKYLEAAARSRSNLAIRSLLALRPATAHRRNDDGTVSLVAVDDVRVGDVLEVAPGERIPVDGVVLEGESTIDRAILTGESIPVDVRSGSIVEQGTIDGDGALVIRAKAVGAGTELARIIDIVRKAQGSTPPVQRLADRVSAIFVPVILVVALLTFAAWIFAHHSWVDALVTAVAVLVVACPCALGLATPTAIIAGVGAGARRGILFKDASAMERAATIDRMVFDKTGTLTRGTPEVVGVRTFDGASDAQVLELAASLERRSTHPLASAIVRAADARGLAAHAIGTVRAARGAGVFATVDDVDAFVGTPAFLRSNGVSVPADESELTRVFVARGRTTLGAIDIADTPRDDARATVDDLRALGITSSLASGDSEGPVRAVAAATGISDWHARLSPEAKAQLLHDLRESGSHVGFVGDGINDAPSLAAANVGFAMGSGAAVALETAHAAILSGDPHAVVDAIQVARRTMRTIRQNLFWAFAYNVILVPLAAFGIVHPALAAAAMGASSLFVVGNSLLLARR